MNIIITILWPIYFVISAIFTLIPLLYLYILGKIGKAEKKTVEANKYLKAWARSLFVSTGSKVIIEGEENIPEGPVLFVANHQSDFDTFMSLGYIKKPMGFISKIEMKKAPIISKCMEYVNCVFIDRKNPRQSILALKDAERLLTEGYSMFVFPEGTRSRSENMGEFKTGALKIATKTQTPIVPIAINGTYKIFEGRKFGIGPAKVTMKILPAIQTKDIDKKDEKAFAEQLQDIIKKSL